MQGSHPFCTIRNKSSIAVGPPGRTGWLGGGARGDSGGRGGAGGGDGHGGSGGSGDGGTKGGLETKPEYDESVIKDAANC